MSKAVKTVTIAMLAFGATTAFASEAIPEKKIEFGSTIGMKTIAEQKKYEDLYAAPEKPPDCRDWGVCNDRHKIMEEATENKDLAIASNVEALLS
jgi:hypothetical protein